jgi:hypothetical protein
MENQNPNIIALTANTRVFVHCVLLTSYEKKLTQHVKVAFNTTPDAALGEAIRETLKEFPSYQIAGVTPLTFEVTMPKKA